MTLSRSDSTARNSSRAGPSGGEIVSDGPDAVRDRRVIVSAVVGSNRVRIKDLITSMMSSGELPDWLQVVVTVNNPGDKELEDELRRVASVQTIVNPSSRGYAANHNAVLRDWVADYYLLANDDIVADPDVVPRLVDFLEAPGNERVAVVSPKLLNADGTLQASTYSFPSLGRTLLFVLGIRDRLGNGRALRWLAERLGFGAGRSRLWQHDRTVVVDSLMGAFVLVRGEAVEDVGPMSEETIVGGEEFDWHWRMKEKGWKVAFLSTASVVHFYNETVSVRPELQLEYMKGWINFFFLYRPGWQVPVLRAAFVLKHALRWARRLIARDRDGRAVARRGVVVALRWRPTGGSIQREQPT
jgi:GT2 family glycosyltransferase